MTDALVQAVTDGDTVCITLKGEIDMANATLVEDEVADAITNQMTTVSIDLTEVTYLDSAGLRILFGLVDRLPTLQIDLELVASLTSPARRVIELSGLAAVVAVRPEVPGAAPG
jgi:anti-anti-sigma factor